MFEGTRFRGWTAESTAMDRDAARTASTRRQVLRRAAGAGTALAGLGAGGAALAQDGTPAGDAPAAPSDLTVEGKSQTTFSLDWSHPDASAVDHFDVFADGSWYPFQSARTGSYVTGLEPGRTYDLAVEAVGPDGATSERVTTTATTDSFDVPGVELTEFSLSLPEERPDDLGDLKVHYGEDDSEVLVAGYLEDVDPCHSYYVGEVELVDGTLSVLLTYVPVGPSDCPSQRIPGRYALYFDVDEAPDAVEVRHPQETFTRPIGGLPKVDGVRPRDLDGDGLYVDLNANDRRDLGDALTYYEHRNDAALTDYPEAYDYDGDGDVDAADVIEMLDLL